MSMMQGSEVGEVTGSEVRSRAQSPKNWLILGIVLALIALICIGQSGMKLFWYDELITLRIAKLASLKDILQFYESGKDTTSFLPAMLVHLCLALGGPAELVTRLPFTLAYLGTCFCVWLFAIRRYSPAYAIAGTLLFVQGWSLFFASEVRAYAFLMLGAAIALVCWQRAGEAKARIGLCAAGVWAGLSLSILFHFFAIFMLVPFAFAEWFYSRFTGQRRLSMWAAILLFPASLVVMLPNMLRAHSTYAHSFWSKPSIGLMTDNYGVFISPIGRNMAGIAITLAVYCWYRRQRGAGAAPAVQADPGYSWPEWVLLIGFATVPFIAFFGSLPLGIYRTQYLLYFQVGSTLLVLGGLAEALRRDSRPGVALAIVFALMLGMHERDRFKEVVALATGRPSLRMGSEFDEDWVQYLEKSKLPIVVEGADTLLLTDYYAPALRPRLVLLTSHERAEKYPSSMTNELNMEVFGQALKLPVANYDQFTSMHKDFLLLVSPEQFEFTWLYRSLVAESLKKGDVQITILWGDKPTQQDQVYLVHFT